MTKRRVRLGMGLDRQKLADTVAQAYDTVEQLPGLSIDVRDAEDAWLHLMPRPRYSAQGGSAEVSGWLLTFAYHDHRHPDQSLSDLNGLRADGVKLTRWNSGLYASYWLPPELPATDLADLAIALMCDIQGTPLDANVEIALEFGL